uniref:MH2 domain-containing protein n=1 Tax=Panagrellus redivivus TaxID=6233 RepID=A0A7E4UST4_PANRE
MSDIAVRQSGSVCGLYCLDHSYCYYSTLPSLPTFHGYIKQSTPSHLKTQMFSIPPSKQSTSEKFTNYTKDKVLSCCLPKKVSITSLMPPPARMPVPDLVERKRTDDSVSSSANTADSGCFNDEEQSGTNTTTITYLGSTSSTMVGEASVEASNSSSLSFSASSGRHAFPEMMKDYPSTSYQYKPFEPFVNTDGVAPPNADAIDMPSILSMTEVKTASPAKGPSILKRLRNRFRAKTVSCVKGAQSIEYLPIDDGPYIDNLGDNWLKLKYHEFKDVCGTNFESSSTEVSVTGLSQMSSDSRFSIFSVSRPNRDLAVHRVRQCVKEGIRFYYEGRNVWLDCIGPQQIFVQAPLYAYCNSQPLSTVFRLKQGNGMPVFSAVAFDHLLKEAENIGRDSIVAIEQLCSLRISFVKGWGQNYASPTILTLPVWLEVHFLHAFGNVDHVLAKVKQAERDARRAAHARLLEQQAQANIVAA